MLEPTHRSQAVTKIRTLFRLLGKPLTITEIRSHHPELKSSQVSMTLCYLMKQRYVMREQVENRQEKKRKLVWQYTYDEKRYLPEVPVYVAD